MSSFQTITTLDNQRHQRAAAHGAAHGDEGEGESGEDPALHAGAG